MAVPPLPEDLEADGTAGFAPRTGARAQEPESTRAASNPRGPARNPLLVLMPTPHRDHVLGSDRLKGVSETGPHIGEHARYGCRIQIELGHNAIVLLSVHGDFALKSVLDRQNGIPLIGEIIGLRQRRKGIGNPLAIGLMAGGTNLG